MQRLVLIRHSAPEEEPDVPAAKWHLGEDGRRRAQELAKRVAALRPVRLISSDEPKAMETADPIAAATGLELEIDRGVREHDRTGAKYLPSDDWRALVIDSLRRPEELVLGAETTGDAGRRFGQAVSDIASRSNDGAVVIVSHGAAMSAFLARLTGLDVVETWQRFGLPGYLVVKWPEADGIEEEWRWQG